MRFPHLSSKLDEQMPYLPPPSSEAVAALVRELRSQLGMALFGVDVIINIHTHTLTVIDINVFPGEDGRRLRGGGGGCWVGGRRVLTRTPFPPPGYEGVPQFLSSLLDHIESVLKKQTCARPQPAGPPEPSATPADPPVLETH